MTSHAQRSRHPQGADQDSHENRRDYVRLTIFSPCSSLTRHTAERIPDLVPGDPKVGTYHNRSPQTVGSRQSTEHPVTGETVRDKFA